MQKIIHTSIHQSRNNNLYIINHLKVVSSKLYYLMSGASMAGGQLQRRIFSEAVCFSDWISDRNFWNIMMPSGKLNRAFFGVFQLFRSKLCRRHWNSWRVVPTEREIPSEFPVEKQTTIATSLIWDFYI